ncbi:DNA polymerase I [Arenimonas sp.]|jgi:DNA polymerase-1|uniref:DNA polymerase I n=1 Tax=Arenimonas sp. TaxID=1872635 RepID=UPI0037C08CB2
MPKLVLIDGSSYLYRAFHALPPLTAADGTPTGALFGIVNMLKSSLKENPEYIAFVLDAPGPTFRDALYPEYKANRSAMPDDLRAQVEPMIAIVQALGLPVIRVSGVEADDVIGTYAVQAAKDGINVVISTGDKDFAQLVGPRITLTNTMTGSVTDEKRVPEKFGVRADQVIDFLALMGDAVDNVKGVEKCGPKTAAKWLAEYGTLDAIIAGADKFSGKIGDNLRAALPVLPLNRTLVTIKTDVSLDRDYTQLLQLPPHQEDLSALYTRFGFKQALKELDGSTTAQSAPKSSAVPALGDVQPALLPEAKPGEYTTVLDWPVFDAMLAALNAAELVCFDTETDSLDPMQANLVGLSFAVEPGAAWYIPLAHDYPGAPSQLPLAEVLLRLTPLLTDAGKGKCAQNGKYDLHVLNRQGIAVQGLCEDTLLASFVLNAGRARHDMDSMALNYLGYQTIAYSDVAGKGAKQIPFSQVAVDDATRYAAEDADITLRLQRHFDAQLRQVPALELLYRNMEIPLQQVLCDIEENGVLVDSALLQRQSADLSARMLQVQNKAYALAGRHFNLDSPKQLGALLFDEIGLEAKLKTPTGAPSTNEEALEAIADDHELPRLILDYRGMAKLRSTYTDKLPLMINPRTGRVHTSYHMAGAATGRLSSSDPNLQNIPVRTEDGRKIREAFIAPLGRKILSFDYSQIELRIMAHLSDDAGLLAAFGSGQDVHRATAAEVFAVPLAQVSSEQRRAAKAINFGLMYGMSAFGLARQLGIGRNEAAEYISLYFSRYPGVRAYMDETRAQAKSDGYVETVFGRRLYLNEINGRNAAQRAGAERAAINAPMQGTAADIIKRAMIDVAGWIKGHRRQALMLMQVHDELVFEADVEFVPRMLAEIKTRMEAAADLKVPLLVEAGTGDNWNESH